MGNSGTDDDSRIPLPAAADLKAGNGASNWHDSKWLANGELVVVALIFVADARHLIPFSKTPFLLVAGWPRCGCAKSVGGESA